MIAKIKNSNNPDIKDFTYIDIGGDFNIKQFFVNDIRYRYRNFLNQVELSQFEDALNFYIQDFIYFEMQNGRIKAFEEAIEKLVYKDEKSFLEDFHKIMKQYEYAPKITIQTRTLAKKINHSVTYIIHTDLLQPIGVIAEETIDKDVFILSDNGKTIDMIKK